MKFNLNELFQLNKIQSEEELVENDHEMLKSMANTEPVVNIFYLLDDKFKIQETKAFVDLYSICCNIPVNLIKEYFSYYNIQYIYLIPWSRSKLFKDIGNNLNFDNNSENNYYYIFMYTYDSNPEMLSRKQTFCKAFITVYDSTEKIRNLMGLSIQGFKELKLLTYNYDYYYPFYKALKQSLKDMI